METISPDLMYPSARRGAPRAIAVWLSICCVLLFAMVVLGGAVRLSDAGLSMVDWRPLGGVIPPLGHAQWLAEFDQYRRFPEFQLRNPQMTLVEFQFIYWMEYAHRMLGRVIGAVFAVPLFIFWRRNKIPGNVLAALCMLLALGAFQGWIGWYMVQSGLVDQPFVSHRRLLVHFMLAAVIYAWMLRLVVGLFNRRRRFQTRRDLTLKANGAVALLVLMAMLASGVLVAGTHAGLVYNTWPKMNGEWVPQQLAVLEPWWRNLLDHLETIQFTHRALSVLVVLAVGVFAFNLVRAGRFFSAMLMLALLFTQFALGVGALTQRVPFTLAVAHQTGAMLLLSSVVIAWSRYLRALGTTQK